MSYFRTPQLNLLKKKGFFRRSSNDLTKYRAAGKNVIEAMSFPAAFPPQKSKNLMFVERVGMWFERGAGGQAVGRP